MSFIKHLEERIIKRRFELLKMQDVLPVKPAIQSAVQPVDAEIAAMVIEFLCVIAAGLLILIGKPEFCSALMLGAIYLKVRR